MCLFICVKNPSITDILDQRATNYKLLPYEGDKNIFNMDSGIAIFFFKNPIDCTFDIGWDGRSFFSNSKQYFKNFIKLPTWQQIDEQSICKSPHAYIRWC